MYEDYLEHLDNELRAMQKEGSPMTRLQDRRGKPFREFQDSPSWLAEDLEQWAATAEKPAISRKLLLRVGLILWSLASFFAGYWVGAR